MCRDDDHEFFLSLTTSDKSPYEPTSLRKRFEVMRVGRKRALVRYDYVLHRKTLTSLTKCLNPWSVY